MKTNGRKIAITAADIDRYALLDQKSKELTGTLNDLKERLREFLEPGQQAVGYAFMVELSEVPVLHGKPDYRKELVTAIGIEKVEAMEKAYHEIIAPGPPRLLPPKPNPGVTPEMSKMYAKIVAEVRASF